MKRPVGVSSGGRATNTIDASAGVRSWRRTWASAAAIGRLRAEDHRLGGHQTTRGVVLVREQAPDVLGLVGLHELEQLGRLVVGQLAQQVGGVVGLHRLEHVGGARQGEALQDAHLVVLGQLLQHVGQPLVVQRAGHLQPPRQAEVVQDVGEVGRLEVLVLREQQLGALGGARLAEPRDLVDGHQQRLAAPAQDARAPGGVAADEHLGDDPVAVALQLDGDVLDGRLPGAVDELDRAVQQLAHGEGLEGPLLEPAHVHQAGRDDLPGVDRGDAGEREEHAAARGHLDDEPDGAGQPFGAHQHDDVAHPSHLVTEGVEHVGPGKARDEHPGPDAAHVGQPRPGTGPSAAAPPVVRPRVTRASTGPGDLRGPGRGSRHVVLR